MDDLFAIEYAGSPAGNAAEMAKLLKNEDGSFRSKEEIAKLVAAWNDAHPDGPGLEEYIRDEAGGRDEFDALDALEGEPATPEERLQRMRKRVDFENSGILSGVANVFTESDEIADAQLAMAEEAYAKWKAAGRDEEREQAEEEMRRRDELLTVNADEHRHALDQVVALARVVLGSATIPPARADRAGGGAWLSLPSQCFVRQLQLTIQIAHIALGLRGDPAETLPRLLVGRCARSQDPELGHRGIPSSADAGQVRQHEPGRLHGNVTRGLGDDERQLRLAEHRHLLGEQQHSTVGRDQTIPMRLVLMEGEQHVPVLGVANQSRIASLPGMIRNVGRGRPCPRRARCRRTAPPT